MTPTIIEQNSLPCLKINYNEYIERIEKIRLRYGINN
jgi:hypothetical protein